MFTNERRVSAGLGGILTVGLTMVAYVLAAGLMFQGYAHGQTPKIASDACQMLCRSTSIEPKNG